MAVNYIATNGQDLDDVFDFYVRGSSPSATGFLMLSGVDINTRYAPIVFGSAASSTGYQISNGNDLNTLFAAKGTAVYWPDPLPWEQTFIALPATSPDFSRGILEFRTDGNLYWKNSAIAFAVNQGSFLPDGTVASQVEIQAVQLSGIGALQNDLSSFVPITSTRTIIYSSSVVGTYNGVFQITIRKIADVSDNATGQCTIRISIGSGGE